MRRARILGALALLAAGACLAGQARAQQVAVHFGAAADTVVGAIPGVAVQVPVNLTNPWYAQVQTATRLTYYFDTTKLQLLGVVPIPGGDSILSISSGPGYLTVVDSGTASGNPTPLYRLRVMLNSGVTDGTYLWVRGDSVALLNNGTKPVWADVGQICHATAMWGDVDLSGGVDSRDALVTLSAAVGLTIPPAFDLALADVDEDGLITSRDALMMLSWTIALPITVTNRVAVAEADACPGLTAPGDNVAFQRTSVGLEALGGASVTPTLIAAATSYAASPQVRLGPDGRTLLYACPGSAGQQICRVDVDTGGVVMVTNDSMARDSSPDWSPSGDSIVYLRNGYLYKVGAGGGFGSMVPGPGNGVQAIDVKWGRDSTKLAYVSPAGAVFVSNSDGTSPVQVVTTGVTGAIQDVRWSPGGDSLAFTVSGDGRFWVVPSAGGAAAIVMAPAGSYVNYGFDWGRQGIIFTYLPAWYYTQVPSIWVIRGVNGPLYRVTQAPPSTIDLGPSWRRSP